MSDVHFWKPVSKLFRPEKSLVDEELRAFYVLREDSPVDKLAAELALDDEPTKYLLAGHRGGGKTTELRRMETRCKLDYTVVWVDTDTNLDKFNIGHAEVVVLIGMTIVQQLEAAGWSLPPQLCNDLLHSLAQITYQDTGVEEAGLELPKVFADLGLRLRVGLQQQTRATVDVRPALSKIIDRVNAIIEAAQSERFNLLVIVDGLDRKEYDMALEMFSSSLPTALHCHIVYAVPISLRYSPAFAQLMEGFSRCLDLDNVPVFKCDDKSRPTTEPDAHGRKILSNVITKRLNTLSGSHEDVFDTEAITLLCEKSGGLMRELIRLAKTACMVALQEKSSCVTLEIALKAVREVRRNYSIEAHYFSELDAVNRTGAKTGNVYDSPTHGKIFIFEELLHHKLILGYVDPVRGRWFDINPILADDLTRWRAAKEEGNGSSAAD